MSRLDADIASRMLSALILDQNQPIDAPKDSISITEQIRYLKRHIDTITIEDRKSIGNILIMNNKRSLLHPCAEGTALNLDAIPPNIIEQMYNLVVYIMSRRV